MYTDIKDYQQKVADVLARDYFSFKEGFTLRSETIRKNNGINLHAICVLENNTNVSPTFYMEEYMEEGFEPEAAAHNVYKNYQKHRREQNEIASMDFTRLYNFDAIKTLSALRLLTVRKMQK